jgi:LPS sulfotransferase NodH
VFLERSNILAQFASLTGAQDTGMWMKFADAFNPADVRVTPPPPRVRFDFPRFKRMFDQRHGWITFVHDEMARRRRKYVHLVYEEHLNSLEKQAGTMKTLKDSFGFDINVDPSFLQSSVRLVKSASVPLRERFLNPEAIPELLTRAFPLDEVE